MILSQVLCCGDNKAIKACCTDVCTCQAGALLCDSSDCQCNINHKECTIKSFPISQLAQALHHKGKSYLPVLKELIKFYDNTIKMITIQKQEVLMIMQECSLTLIEQQKDIYLKLKNKQVLMAKDMRMILHKLTNESKMNIDQRLKGVSQMTKKFELEINTRIKQLKQFQQLSIAQKSIQVEVQVQNSKIVQIAYNIKKTLQIQKKIGQITIRIPDEILNIQQIRKASGILIIKLLRCFATIDAEIPQYQQKFRIPNKHFLILLKPILTSKILEYRTFYFKIINIPTEQTYQRSLFIGIIRANTKIEKYKSTGFFATNLTSDSCRGINSYKKIIGSSLSEESNFSLQKNDVIRVDFDPKNEKLLLFKNNISTIIHNVYSSYNWCLCVAFQQSGQEVQYLGEYDPITNKPLQ